MRKIFMRMAMGGILAGATALPLIGCQSPRVYALPSGPGYAWVPIKHWNDQTRYRAVPMGDAFRLDVYYPRTTDKLPQSVVSYMSRAVPGIAQAHAARNDRTIQPLENSRIRIEPGFDPQAGQSIWHAWVRVDYQPSDRS